MPAPLLRHIASPYTGPSNIQAWLAESCGYAVYEGIWVPVGICKNATVEVLGTFSTVAGDIIGTNSPAVGQERDPLNYYTITVGGSVTNNDTLTASFFNQNLPNGRKNVPVTVSTGNSTSVMAAALAAAIVADTDLQSIGLTASVVNSVITISYPSVPPNAMNTIQGGGILTSNATGLTCAVAGGGTETLTVACASTGTVIQHFTAVGLTSITQNVGWIKGRITALTGTNAVVSMAYNGAS